MTMGVTPFVVNGSERAVRLLFRALIPATVRHRLDALARVREETRSGAKELKDHLVVIGFGLNGRNVSQTATLAGIPHVVVEIDNGKATTARELGHAVIVGDASNELVLAEAGVTRSRVVVVALSEASQSKEVVAHIRMLSDAPHVIVRTRYVRDMEDLLKLGANEVVPEEFETSIEVFARALRHYLVPENELEDLINKVRGAHYSALRNMGKAGVSDKLMLHASDMELAALPALLGRSRVVGRRLGDADIKGRFGVTVLAIKRGPRVITAPDPDMRVQSDDILYVLGDADGIAHLDRSLRE
jgi:CPA2 family monovalent cation:H+ antiporter-2